MSNVQRQEWVSVKVLLVGLTTASLVLSACADPGAESSVRSQVGTVHTVLVLPSPDEVAAAQGQARSEWGVLAGHDPAVDIYPELFSTMLAFLPVDRYGGVWEESRGSLIAGVVGLSEISQSQVEELESRISGTVGWPIRLQDVEFPLLALHDSRETVRSFVEANLSGDYQVAGWYIDLPSNRLVLHVLDLDVFDPRLLGLDPLMLTLEELAGGWVTGAPQLP